MCSEWLIGGFVFWLGKKAKVRGVEEEGGRKGEEEKREEKWMQREMEKKGGEFVIAFVAAAE